MAPTPPSDAPTVDPRVARSRAAVLDATLDLLAERGWSGTTVAGVSERSGVAKTTIYRHWPTLSAVVLDAFGSLPRPAPGEPSHDLYADLVTMLCALADELEQARWSQCLPALVEAAEREPEIAALAREVEQDHRRPLVERLAAAAADRHLPHETDVELMAHMLADPLFYRRLLTRERTPTRFIEALVDRALRAFGA